MRYQIEPLLPHQTARLQQAAQLLVSGFADYWPESWRDIESALAEVAEATVPERLAFAAVAPDGQVLGWIGAIPEYRGRVFELHPLVVHHDHRRLGIGRALVEKIVLQASALGGLTLWVGTDDEAYQTSLGGLDLYPDPLIHAARITNRGGHPIDFYRRLGFAVAGVLPDANGFGKPDIFMARRIGQSSAQPPSTPDPPDPQ
ncbi:MAG: GNAT family N-acetyltransferase [Chloroflexota bacterium]